jgi:hypothetical protein
VYPSNACVFRRTVLNAVYEVGFDVGFRLTQRMKVFGGYTFLLWDGAVRSGDQVDLVVHPDQPAGVRPWVPFKDDVFWAQGLNFGLEVNW